MLEQRAIKQYRKGKSLDKIAKMLGMPGEIERIKTILKSAGIKIGDKDNDKV